jgi:hypothetical protein
LRLDAVTAGHRDLAHVHPAEARDLEIARLVQRERASSPARELGLHLRVLPMTDHDRAIHAQARADEPVLPVAVGRLVQVHEIHVDLVPRQLAVELRVQVRQRLLQAREPRDPHLGG